MKKIILTLLSIFFILSLAPSYGQVYKWMDEKGGIHFTDDITQVPEKFRPSIDKIGLPEDRVENRKEVDPTAKKRMTLTATWQEEARITGGRGLMNGGRN